MSDLPHWIYRAPSGWHKGSRYGAPLERIARRGCFSLAYWRFRRHGLRLHETRDLIEILPRRGADEVLRPGDYDLRP